MTKQEFQPIQLKNTRQKKNTKLNQLRKWFNQSRNPCEVCGTQKMEVSNPVGELLGIVCPTTHYHKIIPK